MSNENVAQPEMMWSGLTCRGRAERCLLDRSAASPSPARTHTRSGWAENVFLCAPLSRGDSASKLFLRQIHCAHTLCARTST